MRPDDFDKNFNPYAPPKADLTMPPRQRAVGRLRAEPARLPAGRGWFWPFEVCRIALGRPLLWGAASLLFLGYEWGVIMLAQAIPEKFYGYMVGFTVVTACMAPLPFWTAVSALMAQRQFAEDGTWTGTGTVLLRAFCLGFFPAALTCGSIAVWIEVAANSPREYNGFILTTALLLAALLPILLAAALAALTRQKAFVALRHAGLAALRNWRPLVPAWLGMLAGMALLFCFGLLLLRVVGAIMFAARVSAAMYYPAIRISAAVLGGCLFLLELGLLPYVMVRDMFYDDGTQ